MTESNIDVIKNAFPLKEATDQMAIKEQEMAVGTQLRVVHLANCLSIAFTNDNLAIASHIGPFGGEKLSSIGFINEACQYYIDVIKIKYGDEPKKVIIRSRQIGSRPLFHSSFIQKLKNNFPNATFDVLNSTSLLVLV